MRIKIGPSEIALSGLVAIAVTLLTGTAVAQERIVISGPGEAVGQMPGMPGSRPAKTGSGRIVGRIFAAETGTPLRRAQVRISGPDIGSKAALSDAQGRYEFKDLPAGRFTLSASKAGYVNIQVRTEPSL